MTRHHTARTRAHHITAYTGTRHTGTTNTLHTTHMHSIHLTHAQHNSPTLAQCRHTESHTHTHSFGSQRLLIEAMCLVGKASLL